MTTSNGNSVAQKWNFLGQESNEELGLGWLTFRYRNYMPEIGRFFGVDPISSEYMSISTYQFAHNNPIWKIEIEGLEGQEKQGKDKQHHEPVKVQSKTNTGTAVGGAVATKTVQETTKKAAIELSKSYIDDAGRLVLEGSKSGGSSGFTRFLGGAVATVAAFLTPTKAHAPTKNNKDLLPLDNPPIDEKLRVEDPVLKPIDQDDTPVKRYSELVETSKPGRKTKGKTTLLERDGGLEAANKEFDDLGLTSVSEVKTKKGLIRMGLLNDGRLVVLRTFSSDGRVTMEVRNPKNGRGEEIRYNE